MAVKLVIERGMIARAVMGEPYTNPENGRTYPPSVRVGIVDMTNLSGEMLELRCKETDFKFLTENAYKPSRIEGEFSLGMFEGVARPSVSNLMIEPIAEVVKANGAAPVVTPAKPAQ